MIDFEDTYIFRSLLKGLLFILIAHFIIQIYKSFLNLINHIGYHLLFFFSFSKVHFTLSVA